MIRRNFMKKGLAVLICLFVVVSLAFGVTEINFMNFSSSGDNVKHMEEMKALFEEENPEIKVNIETVGFGDYFTKLMTIIAGNNSPDCFELNYENFSAYAKKNVLMNLGDLIVENDFDTSVINQKALEAFQVDGVQYGLPFSFSNVVLIYNKELFDEAGVEYPDNSWTWADEQKVAEKIRALGPMTFGINHPVQFSEFYKVVHQNGGSIFNEDKTAFAINTPQNVETLQFMIDRVVKTNVMPTEAQLAGMGDWDLFEAGLLGMIVTGSWAFPTFTSSCDFDWDIAVEPGNLNKATHFFSNGIVISKDTKKAEACFKWISFLSTDEDVARIRIDAGWELPAITNQEIIDYYCSIKPPANKEAIFESLDYLVTPPVVEQYAEMEDIINNYLEKARDGVLTAQEALEQAQKELSEKIEL